MFDKIREKFLAVNASSRWQAGGYGCGAILFGFQRPTDDSDGFWVGKLGRFHDSEMAAFMSRLLRETSLHMETHMCETELINLMANLDNSIKRLQASRDTIADAPDHQHTIQEILPLAIYLKETIHRSLLDS